MKKKKNPLNDGEIKFYWILFNIKYEANVRYIKRLLARVSIKYHRDLFLKGTSM